MFAARLALVSLVAASCSPWEAYRTARLRAAEDLRCEASRIEQVSRPGRNPSSYAFRCGATIVVYECQQHPSVTLCRRTY